MNISFMSKGLFRPPENSIWNYKGTRKISRNHFYSPESISGVASPLSSSPTWNVSERGKGEGEAIRENATTFHETAKNYWRIRGGEKINSFPSELESLVSACLTRVGCADGSLWLSRGTSFPRNTLGNSIYLSFFDNVSVFDKILQIIRLYFIARSSETALFVITTEEAKHDKDREEEENNPSARTDHHHRHSQRKNEETSSDSSNRWQAKEKIIWRRLEISTLAWGSLKPSKLKENPQTRPIYYLDTREFLVHQPRRNSNRKIVWKKQTFHFLLIINQRIGS